MKIDEIKTQADKIIKNSISIALGIYEGEDENTKKTGLLNAKIAGQSLAIEYLYSVIEKI